MGELTVAELAEQLGVSHRRASDLMARGTIDGRQLVNGIWLVDGDSATRYGMRRASAGRHLDPKTAWAILFELSRCPVDWIPRSTHARLRQRIAQTDVRSLAIAVAQRTRVHNFTSANRARASADLISTGRAAAHVIHSELLTDERRVQGYVPCGMSVDRYAADHFMVRDSSGPDQLYENTAPAEFARSLEAVVAADLSMSVDTREKTAGLTALAKMRESWLENCMR